MRANNQYIVKIIDELDVYRKYMLDENSITLTPTQSETFQKMDTVRAWLLDGYSDSQIIRFCKTDPKLKIQDRRAREILAMSYELFADLRISRSDKGTKQIYADIYTQAAADIKTAAMEAQEAGQYKEAAALWREWRGTLKEAGIINNVYRPDAEDISDKKTPKKVIIKKVVVNNYGDKPTDQNILDIPHEEQQ